VVLYYQDIPLVRPTKHHDWPNRLLKPNPWFSHSIHLTTFFHRRQHTPFGFNIRTFTMSSFNISQQEGPTDMNQAVRDSHYDRWGDKATNLLSPSRVRKSKLEQSSSSKKTSKASNRKGKECSTEAPQEKEKRALSETPEAKKKRRQEKKAKKEQQEKGLKTSKSVLEDTESRSIGRKEKGLKTSKSVLEDTETRSIEFLKDRRSVSVAVVQQQCKEYQQHRREQTTAARGSIAGNGMVIDTASTSSSIARIGSVKRDNSLWTDKSCFSTEETRGKVLDELNLLRYNVKTLSFQLKSAKETIRQLDNRNARMSDLVVQLVKTEEQLEYTTEENKEYSSRVRALEQALILQESDLDNALTVMAKRERNSVEMGQETSLFGSEDVDENISIQKESLASEEADEQFLIYNELKAVRGELEQAQQERDMAVDKATAVSIQLAELKAEKDESRDQSTESHALIEQMRALMWQRGSATIPTEATKRGFFWKKDDVKPGMSSNGNECIDATEDNTSMSSDDLNGSWDDMGYHERRSQEEACMELTL
jgi:hypothetical protein